MDSYDEAEFRGRVDAALRRIRTVLDNTRNPQLPADVPHRYDDKYHLVEFLARVSVASILQCLHAIGLANEDLGRLRDAASTRSVTLRLRAQEDCRYLREETRKVESAQEIVAETKKGSGAKTTSTAKVVTTVIEHFWSFTFRYELVAFVGTADDKPFPLLARAGGVEIKTSAKTTPRPQTVVRPAVDANITWLLRHVDAEQRAAFTIDRTQPSCHTPRRNREVDEALVAFGELYDWCGGVATYFGEQLFPVQQDHGLDLGAIDPGGIFVPAVPLFEKGAGELLPAANAGAFLAEEQRSLAAKRAELERVFPRNDSVITVVEVGLIVILIHAAEVCQQFANGVTYVEEMLRKQLIAAIGKELTAADFGRYMEFHHKKLVKPAFQPRPFSHAVRRPDHDPEGVLSLEAQQGSAMADPIATTVAVSAAVRPMSFALDASTRVSFLGDRYLHAWISHQFSGASDLALSLVARARQFSSFVLLVGRIASADVFEPRFGVIIQNKDVLKIPLLLEQIPTPKEFRDAIESLSEEQQRFAKAFRAMQLESTLFGVCVIQIKPQLERLLRLDADSLTKEIKLTQELLGLFIEYQLPSDLLSYDGPAEAPAEQKLARVKEYVARMQEMIGLSKQRELEEEQQREALRLAEMNRTPPPPSYSAAPGGMPMPMMGGGAPPMAMTMRGGPIPGPPPPPMRSAAPPPSMVVPSPQPVAAPPPPEPVATQTAARALPPAGGDDPFDYTKLPGDLDKKFDELDEDGAVRPTIINPGDTWSRTSQKGLLSSPATTTLRAAEQKTEKSKAFDLLDALSKSGALPVEHASLHVVLAATHRFDRTLVDTVIQANVNPIEKVERSLMIVATTIHGRPAGELLMDDQRERFLTYSPRLGPA